MPERPLGDDRSRAALLALHERQLNFDPPARGSDLASAGWRLDHYCQALPSEPPGPPVPGASWETARRLMLAYEFADPRIIRAVFEEDSPLEGRDMLLRARFWGLTFDLGVRVGGIVDERREVNCRSVRVWGWGYRTLQGHLEAGQMDYEVWKWLDNGDVEFRIRAYSRPAAIRNPAIRAGFRLFGRREQLRFARHACERMARLTAEEVGAGPPGDPMERAADAISVDAAERSAR
jgi:uncharacterized protein (UPF0548 family)